MKKIVLAIMICAQFASAETVKDSESLSSDKKYSVGYSGMSVGSNPLSGIKFSGPIAAAVYRQQKGDKKYVTTIGLETAVDIGLPVKRIMPYAAGGFQFGTDSSLYGEIGIDARVTEIFKLQIGVHLPFGFDPCAQFGAAFLF